MKPSIPILSSALALAIFLPLAAQDKPAKPAPTREQFQAAATGMFDRLEAYTKILEGVRDKETAIAAKPAIEKLTKEFKAAVQDAKSLGEPSPEVKKSMESDAKMNERAQAIMKRMVTASQNVATLPEAVTILKSAIVEFQRATQSGNSSAAAPPSEGKPAPKPTLKSGE